MKANLQLTVRIVKGESGYLIGMIEELPEVLTQGETLEETKANLLDALELYLETNRSQHGQPGEEVVAREQLDAA
jgi:predicted RNase H-like HicB family nuclease